LEASVEVLKEGVVPKLGDWTIEVTCEKKDEFDRYGCEAVLKVWKDDLTLKYFRGSHVNHYYTAVQCPRCLKYNRVSPPESVWRPIFSDENKKNAIFDGFSG
jgi:hypothetical protein